MQKIDQVGEKYEDRLKKSPAQDGNQILLNTLEEFTNAGGWYLDLQTMIFEALGNMIYKIYGIEDMIDKDVEYTKFLFDYIVIEDRTKIEQIKMRLLSGDSPQVFTHNIIKQDTGEIRPLTSIAYSVFDRNENVIAFRGITMFADESRYDKLARSGISVSGPEQQFDNKDGE